SQRTTLGFGDVDVSLLWRFLDKVRYEDAQFADDVAAADGANRNAAGALLPVAQQGCPDFQGVDAGGCLVDPAFRQIKATHYFDLSTRFGVTENISLTFSVENLTDKKPPNVGSLVGTAAANSGNTYPSTYDALGRKFAVSARVRF
ncbi:MAG: TonB-dependent receptor, partial [Sphingomonadaceae bacterium]|nr:TonB-dependent receptor [Sphingomonadaceae bacterium]